MCVFPATTLLATRLSHVDIISAFSLSRLRSMSRSSVVGPRGATNMQRRDGRNFFLKAWKITCQRLHRRLVPEAFPRNACTEVVPNSLAALGAAEADNISAEISRSAKTLNFEVALETFLPLRN